uniref:Ribosomal protein L13 n=1 Tax=Brassica oleracea TaxID=3712 RepID=A0A3P6B2J4_BRAOL|nr:unnamed protein product [Brassica oleracea]
MATLRKLWQVSNVSISTVFVGVFLMPKARFSVDLLLRYLPSFKPKISLLIVLTAMMAIFALFSMLRISASPAESSPTSSTAGILGKYVGHLKERSLKDQMAKDPTEVIRKAVWRMLPTNNLRDDRDRKLRIFEGNEHPFGDKPLEPFVMPPRTVREMRPRARRAMIRAQKKAELAENGGTEVKKGKKRTPSQVTA